MSDTRVPTGTEWEVHVGPFEAAPGVEVLGRVEPAGRIVAVRQGGLLATSFHPELAGDARVHALFVEIVKEQAL